MNRTLTAVAVFVVLTACAGTGEHATVDDGGTEPEHQPAPAGSRRDLPVAAPVPADVPQVPSVTPPRLPTREQPEVLPEAVLFETGAADLKSSAHPILTDLADRIRQHAPEATVTVTGHTDSRGSAAANLSLSRARAQAVVECLIAYGLPRDRLVARGVGEEQLLADDVDSEGRFVEHAGRINRRVEVITSGLPPTYHPTHLADYG